jgi:nicotinate-nucleotide adenylyltransferase
MARIGLFGGTFNPIHRGHIAVARHLRQSFPLERIYLIPARVPPHKTSRGLVPPPHRLAMIELALKEADDADLYLSDVELRRTGPSYTVDTVEAFRKRLEPDDELFLIMGADAFLELDAWRQWRSLLASVSLIVMSRPGSFTGSHASNDWPTLRTFAQRHLDPDYALREHPQRLEHPQLPTIYLTTLVDWEISSSQIRSRLRRGESIRDLVPGPVAAYIASKGLYQ